MEMCNRVIQISSIKNSEKLADKCVVAEDFFSRLKGLLGKSKFVLGEGLLLRPCNDINMWLMKIPIDVIF